MADRSVTKLPVMRPIIPMPADVPRIIPGHPLGKPTATWDYTDAMGRLAFRVCRWDLPDGSKQIRPLCYCEDDQGNRSWQWKAPESARPLLGLVELGRRRDAPVLVVEGEKTRDAAARMYPDFVIVTSSGGGNAARMTDWSPLKNRNVLVWPDNDGPGDRYADDVLRLAREAKAASTFLVQVPPGLRDGWDLADELPDGIPAAALRIALDEAVAAREPTAADAGPVDLVEAGLSAREAVLQICDGAAVWRSEEGEAYVSLPINGHIEHHAVGSRSTKDWVIFELGRRFTTKGRPAHANSNVIRDVLDGLGARARIGGIAYLVSLRVIEHEGCFYIDLGTQDWSVVRVSADGWSIQSAGPVPVLRTRRTAPFATPITGDFESLKQLLHLDHDAFVLFIAWCLGALLPRGPYPILVLVGEQGSGKSLLTRLAQRITDPVHRQPLQPPSNDRDLVAAARNNRVLAFDNVSKLSREMADNFCRLSTGGEIGGRALFTDHDTASFSVMRPIVLNGIPDLTTHGDLADRAIVMRLQPLTSRISEQAWWRGIDGVLPSVFAVLLNALSQALRLRATTTVVTPNTRMADFAEFMVAAEPALPWPEGAFMAAYERSRQNVSATLVDSDVVADAVRKFIGDGATEWTGTVSVLYGLLTPALGASRRADWPGNARWFGERLRRAAPTLRAFDIDYHDRRTGPGTEVTLRKIAALATSAPPDGSQQGADHGASGASGASVASRLPHTSTCSHDAHDVLNRTDSVPEDGDRR